jgi:hypothetical protein
MASDSVKVNRAISPPCRASHRKSNACLGRIVLCALIKKPQLPIVCLLKKFRIINKFAFYLLGIAFAESHALWVGFWLGELGKNTTHAPAGFVCSTYRASTKEVAINCGWVGVARAGRGLTMGIKIMPVFPYLNLLVVTARAAWFNFRGWKKRR